MTRFFGAGGASVIAAACILAIGSASPAAAQVATMAATPTISSLPATQATTIATPATSVSVTLPSARAAILSTTPRPVSGATTAPAGAVAVRPAVTHAGLWPLVWANMTGAALDEEANCVATAVYFEARGEPFDGQLAVAEVVMNRAASGKYPTSYCGVVKQPWQFSFVRGGQFPRINTQSASWSYAQAIARIAKQRLADALPDDVLWYHADYVAPGWGRRLSKVEKIGAHIFYRA
ncbi:cell wall hydrolase [Sphingomonas sp. BN140010]|uniref:Cell wall hydrolase n=1 Tax=Sphingomonas arvum TaxID=2992113 RepID=A0ABT3JCG3_9SPHN|nr:cell wall hydrolase [Sphingomonas sp. BN140010]MCW3796481.1 cell wall hydrolase [Sphingomonas sp. BN140010]